MNSTPIDLPLTSSTTATGISAHASVANASDPTTARAEMPLIAQLPIHVLLSQGNYIRFNRRSTNLMGTLRAYSCNLWAWLDPVRRCARRFNPSILPSPGLFVGAGALEAAWPAR